MSVDFGRRFRRPRRATAALVLLAIAFAGARIWRNSGASPPPKALPAGDAQLERVVDGDTLKLANGARVRLQGVDCPESVKPDSPVEPWGPEASEFTKRFVATGRVRLEFDRERKDKYGRFLAYVYVGDRMLNEELLRAGLARAELGYDYSSAMKRRFRQAESEARAARRGIWSEPVGAGGQNL